jgi:hypothetical protein
MGATKQPTDQKLMLMEEGFQVQMSEDPNDVEEYAVRLLYVPDDNGGRINLELDVETTPKRDRPPLVREIPNARAAKLLLGLLARP